MNAIYLNSMSKHGVFVDALFIQYFANMLEKDVIIVHPSTGSGYIGDFKALLGLRESTISKDLFPFDNHNVSIGMFYPYEQITYGLLNRYP